MPLNLISIIIKCESLSTEGVVLYGRSGIRYRETAGHARVLELVGVRTKEFQIMESADYMIAVQ